MQIWIKLFSHVFTYIFLFPFPSTKRNNMVKVSPYVCGSTTFWPPYGATLSSIIASQPDKKTVCSITELLGIDLYFELSVLTFSIFSSSILKNSIWDLVMCLCKRKAQPIQRFYIVRWGRNKSLSFFTNTNTIATSQ